MEELHNQVVQDLENSDLNILADSIISDVEDKFGKMDFEIDSLTNNQISNFLNFLDERIPCLPNNYQLIVLLYNSPIIGKVLWSVVYLAAAHKSKIKSKDLDNINMIECEHIKVPYVFSCISEQIMTILVNEDQIIIHKFDYKIDNVVSSKYNNLTAASDQVCLIIFDQGVKIKEFDYEECAFDFYEESLLVVTNECYEFYDIGSWDCYQTLPLINELRPRSVKWINTDTVQVITNKYVGVLIISERLIYGQECSVKFKRGFNPVEHDQVTCFFDNREITVQITSYQYALCKYAERNAGNEIDQLLEIIDSELFKRIPVVGQNQFRTRYEEMKSLVEAADKYF